MIESRKAVTRPELSRPGLIDSSNTEEYSRCLIHLQARARDGETELLLNEWDVAAMEEDFAVDFYRRERRIIAGYAASERFENQTIMDIMTDGTLVAECYFNIEGDPVRPRRIERCEGFRDYTERGSVLFIDKFELFPDSREKGCGRAFLNELVSSNRSELLFLHARDEEAACYFEHLGFMDTGLRNGSTREVVLAFHNAEFSTAPF